ncbi:MAG: ABC transporter permease, partial [Clostridiales Family XIII bacterium]|nr:ABC transporter permease [Clostridiales Family XIII bacterium]
MLMFTQTETEGAAALKGEETENSGNRVVKLLFKYNAVLLLVIMFIVACVLSEHFLSSGNMVNILRQQSTYMLVALGMLMVMLTGGIDLSVSSVVAVASIMVPYGLKVWGLQNEPWGLFVCVLVAIAMGFLFGAINGFLVARLNMPAFIVTLAMMYAAKGVAYIITDANTILLDTKVPAVEAFMGFSTGRLFGIPYEVFLMAIIVVIFFFIMHYTSFGRLITATGSNEQAVQLAGINSRKYKFWAYTLCGALCGIAGLLIAARSGSATALTTQTNFDMTTIAAVVIGGASLKGGEGNVPMTVVGVFVLAV